MKKENKLALLIRHHKTLYYNGVPEISDHQFDELEKRLRDLNPDNPVLNLIGSKTKESKIKHQKKMLSLAKTYSKDDLIKWINSNSICATYKIDGNSCSLIYNNGQLSIAKTRGDGEYGENITNNIMWCKNIPLLIDNQKIIEIRGELYCNEEDFLSLSNEMHARSLDRPSSARNIVAGLLGRKDNIDLNCYVKFMAYDCLMDNADYENETDKFNFLRDLKFDIPNLVTIHSDQDVLKVIEDCLDFYNNGNISIDGIVFTYNDFILQKELGYTSHHPKYKLAYKFKGETKNTYIKKIIWQISRNGILTPVASVDPVEMTGAIISNVTLHNWGNVYSHNLKIGDKVEIIRSGEVIPKLLRTILQSDNLMSYPKICPSCQKNTVVQTIWLKCINQDCSSRIIEEILHFIKNIGIDDLSKKRLEQLVNMKKVSSIVDLFHLSIDDFMELDNFKEKLSTKLINSIQKCKNSNLIKFLSALGLKGGGYNKCELVVKNNYDTIEKVMDLEIEDLVAIDGFAKLSATDFIESLKQKKKMINSLIEEGFIFTRGDIYEKLENLSFCITGTLSAKRSDINNIIRENGGVIKSTITADLSFLITNDQGSNSSKLAKAQKLNITIISEAQFFKRWNLS